MGKPSTRQSSVTSTPSHSVWPSTESEKGSSRKRAYCVSPMRVISVSWCRLT